MTQDWLVCYQIGLNHGASHANGDIHVTVSAMTLKTVKEVREHIRADFIESNPGISSVQKVVITSMTRLDNE